MPEIDIDIMPKTVWRLYQEVLDLTEVAPTVNRAGYGKLVLTHGNDRVQVTVTFRNPGWKWHWKSSTLKVDGEKVPISTSPEHYAAIFADPDTGRYGYAPKDAKKAKIPAMRMLTEEQIKLAPTLVSSIGVRLAQAVSDENASVKTYIVSKDNEYVLAIENPSKGSIYQFIGKAEDVTIIRQTGQEWSLVDLIITNIHGYDVTHEHADRMEEMLMDLLGADSRKNQQPYIPQGQARSQQGMSNSVAVRKNTVRRV